MSAAAQIAAAQGYTVTGCDLQSNTPYIDKVRAAGINVFTGHSPSHLENIDLLAVSPAVFYQNNHHPEIETARKKEILIKWQDFLGTHLHSGKFVICVAGTHGKSTTTALAGELLRQAGLDPTVEVGATVKTWHNNVLLGKSKYFVSEADEFHDNFKTYQPDIIILNNVEMDHPEYFGTFDRLLQSYSEFVGNLKPGGTLIYNAESPGCVRFINSLPPSNLHIPYSIFKVSHINLTPTSTSFTYQKHSYTLSLIGRHNIENTLGIIELATILKINYSLTASTIKSFSGLDRRLDHLGTPHGIQVFDDYANHPTAFRATIAAAKQIIGNAPLWVVIEPHTFSRLRAVLNQLPDSLAAADHVIISKIFASREQDPGDFTGADIATATRHPDCRYIPEFSDIVTTLKSEVRPSEAVLVMGSGQSYQLSRSLLRSL